MKNFFIGLFLISTSVFAQSKAELIANSKDCSYGLSEVLKTADAKFEDIKSEYEKTLMCLDSCYTGNDAEYFANQCVDWAEILSLVHGKSSVKDVVGFLFQNNGNLCSAQKLSEARENGHLSGSYYDPNVGSCVVTHSSGYYEHTLNVFSVSTYSFVQYIRNKEGSGVIGNPFAAQLEDHGVHQNKGALYTWEFKLNLAPPGGNIYGEFAFEALAQLEGGIYKTFGNKNCKPYIGGAVDANAHIYAGVKDPKYNTHLKQVDNASNSSAPYEFVPAIINSGKTDPKIVEAALKAGVGFYCSNGEKESPVYRIELQGDLLRVALFQNMQPDQGMAFAYNHIGKQVNIKGSIHHYPLHNSAVTLPMQPYIEGSVGVGNYNFPSSHGKKSFNALATSLDVTIGGERDHFKFGAQGKLDDLNWRDPVTNSNRNILDLYLGAQVGGVF